MVAKKRTTGRAKPTARSTKKESTGTVLSAAPTGASGWVDQLLHKVEAYQRTSGGAGPDGLDQECWNSVQDVLRRRNTGDRSIRPSELDAIRRAGTACGAATPQRTITGT